MNSEQQQLFEKILELYMKDKLVLWAGAGLSMEAGFPSSTELSQILLSKLTDEEKRDVKEDLLSVSDHYVHLNKKDQLIEILKKVFEMKGKESESHEIIQKMTFFKTIISTNYDKLFESYIPGIQIIKSAKSLSRSKSNSRKLIKIHGDLNSPKRLILTQSDYSNLYNINHQDPFWNKLNVELVEKAVLFIGYGFNDPNIRGLFDYLNRKLKKHAQPKFLIAPNLTKPEILKLKTNNIEYLNLTGNDFLKEFYRVWKDRGYQYFGDTEVSTDFLFSSLKEEGLPVEIGIHPKGNRFLKFIPESGKNWDYTFNLDNPEFDKKLTDWKKGLGSDELIIHSKDLNHANLKIGDFTIGDHKTLPDFKFVRVGNVYKNVSVRFQKTSIELDNIKVRTHPYGEKGLKIILEDKHGEFSLKIPSYSTSGFTFDGFFQPTFPCLSVKNLLNWYEAINEFGSGTPYTIFCKDIPEGFYKDKNGASSKQINDIRRNLLIFQVLREIEKKFELLFSGFTGNEVFGNKSIQILQMFLELFTKNRLSPDYSNGIPISKISKNPEIEIFPQMENFKEEFYFIIEEPENKIKILNQEIDLGLSQLFITNPSREYHKGEAIIKPGNAGAFIYYESFGLPTFKKPPIRIN